MHTDGVCQIVVMLSNRIVSHSNDFLVARVNSLYRVRNNTVIEIVKVDPQQIHQSYRLSSPIEIESSDFVVGQCVFDNIENRTIKVG